MPDFAEQLAGLGPLRLDRYMALSNAHYYAEGDPLGRDFATAPELSQVFGELIGLWSADLWDRAGRPGTAFVELGPGRGTLMADALRAAAKAGWTPQVHLVETSPRLRQLQAERVPTANWYDDVTSLDAAGPMILVANEFFDALPIRQFRRVGSGWVERYVEWRHTVCEGVCGTDIRAHPPFPVPRDVPLGAIVEIRPDADAIAAHVIADLARHGGAALIIDYGHVGPAFGDTLQGIRAGAPVPAFAYPGTADLTAHLDFEPLMRVGRDAGCGVYGPVPQGIFLAALGLRQRTETLARANPSKAPLLRAAALRLSEPQHMGAAFKAMAITAPGWPAPAGFA